MAVETVIFDLGGTLIEYAGKYEHWPELETPGFAAAYEILVENGRALPPFAQFRDAGFANLPRMWQAATRTTANLQVHALIGESLAALGVNSFSNDDLLAAADAYGGAIQQQAFVIEGAVKAVTAVKSAGYKVGLVSNTMFPGEMHKEDMARFGLLAHFDATVFSADVNKWKPNADPFLHVLDALGMGAETAVYVGDDPASDIVGGHAAGMRTIHFPSSQRFHKPDGVEPDAEIQNLAELLPLLDSWEL
ncbi:HAD family hydrolase [Candidatus Leptofilum sp.]|uniref:HAD family hydrolase n=1 Tax=Candidatus Leptofilum sp. TaxID=3241576 RepID=UPI003B5AEE5C